MQFYQDDTDETILTIHTTRILALTSDRKWCSAQRNGFWSACTWPLFWETSLAPQVLIVPSE